MRAVPYLKVCEPEDLKVLEWPDPVIENNNVLIEVKAFGVNFADIMARKGQYADAPSFPFICGYECSGIVKEVGKNVTKVKVGDRVLALTSFGGYAEYVSTKEAAVFHLPDNLSFSQGASIPVNFVTAYHALHETGTLWPGTKVLIHAVAGGVGLAALQLAKLAECEVFGTASRPAKLQLAKDWGADHLINYVDNDFEIEIKRLTDNKGIDIVLDSLGGKNIQKSLKVLRAHGRVICFGASALSGRGNIKNALKVIPEAFSMISTNIIPLLMNSKGLYGVNMKRLSEEREDLIEHYMDKLMQLFKEEKLKTIISKEYSWHEMAKAHTELGNRSSTGKIIMLVD